MTGSNPRTAVVLFTRDLRVHDNPALADLAARADRLVPLFVLDDAILTGVNASANRAKYLVDALGDLRSSLRGLGSDLVIRRGDVVRETMAVVGGTGATDVGVMADVSSYARRREARLADAADPVPRVTTYPGVTVVPPGELTPAGGDHYRVFTPYWRAWSAATWRGVVERPRRLPPLPDISVGEVPTFAEVGASTVSPGLPRGGEASARRRLAAAATPRRADTPSLDDLAADATSRLSPDLHFGCVSAVDVASRLADSWPERVRQLAWRDFHHQVTAAFPDIATRDYRNRDVAWRHDPEALDAWKSGRTGVPIVDAGMRQLVSEGWMHNRARLIAASFLTKTLRIDWREGAAHFFAWLVDGDVANNAGNWQWVAGTGNDTRPNRVLNPLRQARRFDPDGHYVRRHVPELAEIDDSRVHTPWLLPDDVRRRLDYPPPIVEV